MKLDYNMLDRIQQLTLAFGGIFSSHGYSQYKMGKFEEYDLYSKNKDFLVSDSVITFTDTNGKLMALKPDVTLSIIKNTKNEQGIQKLFYNENVYRVSKSTNSFKEIMQSGVECIGDIDSFSIGEVLMLAAESLNEISQDFILEISQLDILSRVIDRLELSGDSRKALIKCVEEKNIHEITAICTANAVSQADADIIKNLISVSGKPDIVLPELRQMLKDMKLDDEITELEKAIEIFSSSEFKDKIIIDFSSVADFNYYNGIIFKGYINSVFGNVLSGGQYDKLMKKMKCAQKAVGFAVYLDMLDRIDLNSESYDADIMLIYDSNALPSQVQKAISAFNKEGKSVLAVSEKQENKNCKQLYYLKDGEVKAFGTDA